MKILWSWQNTISMNNKNKQTKSTLARADISPWYHNKHKKKTHNLEAKKGTKFSTYKSWVLFHNVTITWNLWVEKKAKETFTWMQEALKP
jgi:hypothetical protein